MRGLFGAFDAAGAEDVREYQASGAQILEPPKNQPWGSREMLVADLDGNRLRMASPVEAED
jgi:uncharacterized glyoxalase superfamily protein PhnB